MDNRRKNIVVTICLVGFFLGMGIWSMIKEVDKYSYDERRVLAGKPELTKESVLSGKYMKDFESYALDQFPLRENFRMIKAASEYFVFQKLDNNGIYLAEGHLSKIEYPLNEEMINYAATHFEKIYDKYLKDKGIIPYLAVVPDKNYYLAEKNGILSLDYDMLIESIISKTPFMKSIEIRDLLTLEDYYQTDSHWKQERIKKVADRVAEVLNVSLNQDYEVHTLENPFNGVYVGQSALPVKADTIKYLTSEFMEDCIITNCDEGYPVEMNMYDIEKADSKDSYEIFLSGASALITIENPHANEDKELVIFRDSFGSSLAPLLTEAYRKITLIDTRYIMSDYIGNFVEFNHQDVLFLYSSVVLNHSMALK